MKPNQSNVVKDIEDPLEYVVLTDFAHYDEVNKLIDELDDIIDCQNREEKWEDRLKYIFDQYQDQPHLLDPYLEKLLQRCIKIIGKPKTIERKESFIFRLIYLMVKTRGYKMIIRLMPHEVSDLEPVLCMLNTLDVDNNEHWQARYVLLLWLSIVTIIPFDMSLFDTGDREPIAERIIATGKRFLHTKDVSQIAAAFMLSKFVCRPDAIKNKMLDKAINWSIDEIKNVEMSAIEGHNFMCGLLRFFTYLFKFGKREDLLPYSTLVLQTNNEIDTVRWEKEILLCRLRTKLVQRIGLVFLKMKLISWRYQRGNRVLLHHIGPGSDIPDDNEPLTEVVGSDDGDANLIDSDEADFEVSDHLDEVIDFLINSLKNYYTTVRWSAAKGLGRICSRLPKLLADEVVEAILVLFSRLEGFSAWHGGCLALAELGRRGLLLPARLPEVVPLILKALVYDEKSGECSYGSNVRDAACYVCWSFARAYNPEEMRHYVVQMASALVMVTLFDREVNVRRAAAAAFQENVGRQGQYPHGIDILTTCDYFAVGNLTNCFLNLSEFIASFDEYIIPMINHLAELKVGHWDFDIRELSAKALHKLYPFASDYMLETVLPEFLICCTGLDLYRRQGAILAIGELVSAIPDPNERLPVTMRDQLAAIMGILEARLQFRGLSGELMRRAVSHLVDCCSTVGLDLGDQVVVDKWYQFLCECMQHKEKLVRNAAVKAFPNYLQCYAFDKENNIRVHIADTFVSDCIRQIEESTTEFVQIANLTVLGHCPRAILEAKDPNDMESGQPVFTRVLTILLAAARIQVPRASKWGEARGAAVTAVVDVCETVGLDHTNLTRQRQLEIFSVLLLSLDDYTFDSHGDIGALLREAAMRSLLRICGLSLVQTPAVLLHPDDSEELATQIAARLAQQAMEKIDRTRRTAGSVFYELLQLRPALITIPHYDRLSAIFSPERCECLYWAAPQSTFPLFCELLQFEEYRYRCLLGLAISVGGMTEKTVEHSRKSLHVSLKSRSETEPDHAFQLTRTLLDLLADFRHQDRVALPLLKTAEFLLNDAIFSRVLADDEVPESQELLCSLLDATRTEICNSRDVLKIKAGIEVLCSLLQFDRDVWARALSALMVLIGHQFPIIRKHTASYLYQSLLMYELVDDEKQDEVTNILQDTVWDKGIKEVREIRNQICDLFEIPQPKMKSATATKDAQQQ